MAASRGRTTEFTNGLRDSSLGICTGALSELPHPRPTCMAPVLTMSTFCSEPAASPAPKPNVKVPKVRPHRLGVNGPEFRTAIQHSDTEAVL